MFEIIKMSKSNRRYQVASHLLPSLLIALGVLMSPTVNAGLIKQAKQIAAQEIINDYQHCTEDEQEA
jgi:hypothetical protein